MMKNILVIAILLFLLISGGCQNPATTTITQDSFFKDEVLAYRISLYVGEGGIQEEELEEFTVLYLPVMGIKDISGLEYLKNLEKLDLGGNEISDLSPLSSLIKLEFLSLERNRITDVSPLASLTNLKILHLYNNQITDVTPLSSLVNLGTLSLSNNQITDISSLAALSVDNLTLDGNPLRN
jgi:Leucine-rich repeat (LRR) protein